MQQNAEKTMEVVCNCTKLLEHEIGKEIGMSHEASGLILVGYIKVLIYPITHKYLLTLSNTWNDFIRSSG